MSDYTEISLQAYQGTVRVDSGTWSTGDVKLESYTYVNLPPAGTAGRLVRATDNIRGIWMDTGTQWIPLSGGAINVMEAGAKGDGSTPDSTIINSCITSAQVLGYEVIFPTPPVAYRINADLLITATVKLRGVGLGGVGGQGCQLKGDSGVNILNISAGSGSVVQVEGLYLYQGAIGIKLAGASARLGRESHFNNLDIGNQSDSGISIQNCGMIGTSFSNLNIFGQANYGIYAKTDAGTIQAFHNVLLENVRVSGTSTIPNAAAVHIENSSAGSIAAEITFVNPIIESNGSRGLRNKGNIITLISPHFENNGADGTADIELAGIAGPQTLVTLISGSFSTPNAAQGNRRVLFSGANARYHTLYTLISGGDKIDAAGNTSATSISQDYPPNNTIATILNYTGGATSYIDWSTTLRGAGGQGYIDVSLLKLNGLVTVTPTAGTPNVATISGGELYQVVGAGTGTGKSPILWDKQVSGAGIGNGADTTQDTIWTLPTLPAGTLSLPGSAIEIRVQLSFAANANNKSVGVTFQGSNHASGSVTTSVNAAEVVIRIVRVDSTHINLSIDMPFVSASSPIWNNLLTTNLDSTTSAIVITAASPTTGAANDVVSYSETAVIYP